MAFSLQGIFDYLDTQKPHEVMAAVSQVYEDSQDRGLFSNKFISYSELYLLGYKGFKQMLMSIYQTDPEFIIEHRSALHAIVRQLKKE